MFSIDFSIITIGFGVAALVSGLLALLVVMPRLRRVSRAVREDGAEAQEFETQEDEASLDGVHKDMAVGEYPAVSVIVHARSDSALLATLLEMIMQQDYPGVYEVIVVNDGGDEAVTNVVGRLEMDYRNLYMTFTPSGARSLSRRKLSLTLGIKAARYEYVAILAGNSRLKSPSWLRLMMKHTLQGKDIVAGYGYIVPSDDPEETGRHRLMAFDAVRSAVQYLYSALRGRLYRAFGHNLVYRRQLFFDKKGFADSLNLRYGDDDMFVGSIAKRGNFAVELAPESMVEIVEDNPKAAMSLDKITHDFTGRYVSRAQRRIWALASWLWWGWTVASIGTIVTGLPSLVPLIAVTVLSLVICLPLMWAWRRCSLSLCSRRLFFTVPFFMWAHPLYTLGYIFKSGKARDDNYTWSSGPH